jgi:hypothetical protein
MFTIETGIPIPPPANRGPKTQYPFDGMVPGDSFFVPCSEEEFVKVSNRLTGAISRFRKLNPEAAFSVRRVDEESVNGIRVWCTK